MTTKIDTNLGLKATSVAAISPKAAVRKIASQDSGSSNKSSADTVSLTGSAVQLQDIHKAVSQSSAFDSKRVEALRSQIAQGKYSIDDGAIANKLIKSDSSLG